MTPSPEKKANVRGIHINYDTFGNPAHPPLLLIHGLGMQMIAWDNAFMQHLADSDYFVIRFDNRDVGLSDQMEKGSTYTIQDMADDAAGVLDDLNIESAHILGVSLGGMIAQTLAIHHPQRVRTLTSIMSTTGRKGLPKSTPKAIALLMTPPATSLEESIANAFKSGAILYGSRYPVNEEKVRRKCRAYWERGIYPAGTGRQLAAIMSSGQRIDALAALQVPTLVIHGDEDQLVPISGGEDTANTIPNAKFLVLPGVGHALPEEVWDEVMLAVVAHAK